MFGKNDNDDKEDVVVISSSKGLFGGTDAGVDRNAPRKIISDKIEYFSAETELDAPDRTGNYNEIVEPLTYFSAFAEPSPGGSHISLTERRVCHDNETSENVSDVTVCEDIFKELAELVKEKGLASGNGIHSVTHGLRKNYGGSVDIRFEGGERISFSNNRAPVLTYAEAMSFVKFFRDKMKGEKAVLQGNEESGSLREDSLT